MSKHRRKRDHENDRVNNNNGINNNGMNNNGGMNNNNGYNNRQQFANNPFGINPNQLLSMLGNIDMGQIGSLLQNMNVPGLDFNNLDMGPFQGMMGNMNGVQQSSQAINDDINNINVDNAIQENTSSNFVDDNMQLLIAIRSIVDGRRAEFIDKVINMYNDGIFDEK